MLKLQNISKYYSRSGAVALGLRKINLTLGVGEIVCVVGESGSGKSTLLNVISGLDSYEEGEMYLNGEQTSHYSISDWEDYRKKYVGFVFQNYNLIESYTVVQNVESILILSGYDPINRRRRALEIIEKVGLTKYKNMKTSKLSGGQLQRTVIARALAKDCQIIACDEPTGNLDSNTSKQIIDLLYEISKDKLVIIVTHNFKEVEHIATRKITMHDGYLVENQILKKTDQLELENVLDHNSKVLYKDILLMAFRNITATPLKTLLFFMVLLLLTISTSFIYGSMLNFKDNSANSNQNMYFTNSMKERIILRKKDYSAFSQSELKNLSNKKYVKDIVTGDVALDDLITTSYPLRRSGYYVSAKIKPNVLITEDSLSQGRLPRDSNEIIINTNAIRNGVKEEDILNCIFTYRFYDNFYHFVVVGFTEDKDLGEVVYLNSDILNQMSSVEMLRYNTFSYKIGEIENIPFYPLINKLGLELNDNEIAVDASFVNLYGAINDIDLSMDRNRIIGETITIKVNNIYESKEQDFTIAYVIDNPINGEETRIYLNETSINSLTKQSGVYQLSLIVENYTYVKRVLKDLDTNQYEFFYPYGTLEPVSYLISVLKLILYALYLIIFIGIIFFITYFILRNIMSSKRSDYIILRSIGSTQKIIKTMILFELLVLSFSTYFVTLFIISLNHFITLPYVSVVISKIFKYYRIIDYFYIYVILIILVLLLTRRFNNKLFKNSVMTTFKGEEV